MVRKKTLTVRCLSYGSSSVPDLDKSQVTAMSSLLEQEYMLHLLLLRRIDFFKDLYSLKIINRQTFFSSCL